MNDAKENSIAGSLETKTGMLKYMPKLLKDLWALGSSPNLIIDLLKPLKLPADKTKVLDLGCGKGAVAITLAEKYGFNVLGIDASEDFLREARERTTALGLEKKCQFNSGDIREYVNTPEQYDIVVYASLGNILGNFEQIVGKLRKIAKPSGYIIIDNGFLKTGESVDRPGYEHYTSHDQTIKQLLAHGDRLVAEVNTDEESRKINEEYLRLIKNRAKDIITGEPSAKDMIEDYIRNQKEECKFIDENVSGAVWLLQKS